MFNVEQWRECHKIWDGNAKNVEAVCYSCGACCNMSEKLLFPGENDYLKDEAFKNTGKEVDNPAWMFQHCACHTYQAKPVICKMYPLEVVVDRSGYTIHFRKDEYDTFYSGRCQELEINEEGALAFFDFLFSDYDNRLWWFYHDTLTNFGPAAKKQVKANHGFNFSLPEVEWHLFELGMLGYNKNQNLYNYVPCKDRPDGRELPILFPDYVPHKGQ